MERLGIALDDPFFFQGNEALQRIHLAQVSLLSLHWMCMVHRDGQKRSPLDVPLFLAENSLLWDNYPCSIHLWATNA